MSISRLKKKFATSRSLATSGVWVTYIDHGDEGEEPCEFEFKLAFMGRANRRWMSMSQQQIRADRHKLESGVMGQEESIDRLMKVFCRTVLLDWRGVNDDQGNALPYTPDHGYELLSECESLYDYLLGEAQDQTNFQDKAIRETVGNSQPTSVGS